MRDCLVRRYKMLMLPDDLATVALMGILMNYHTNAQKPDPASDPKWARTPAQEACRALAARIRGGC